MPILLLKQENQGMQQTPKIWGQEMERHFTFLELLYKTFVQVLLRDTSTYIFKTKTLLQFCQQYHTFRLQLIIMYLEGLEDNKILPSLLL